MKEDLLKELIHSNQENTQLAHDLGESSVKKDKQLLEAQHQAQLQYQADIRRLLEERELAMQAKSMAEDNLAEMEKELEETTNLLRDRQRVGSEQGHRSSRRRPCWMIYKPSRRLQVPLNPAFPTHIGKRVTCPG